MAWLALYAASIVLANWLITSVGLVPVGFGLLAPAGVYAAGLTLTLRDLTQDALGRRWAAGAVLAGAALSALLSPGLALASGAAFLVAELADLAVYTPLRRRGLLGAVAASNAVGLVVDSALFLALAFGSLALLPGLVLGKVWATLAALLLLGLLGRRRRALSGSRPA
jgi:uncharacterized PurR-regulated membrane protein YhhQ (DUF165 family)